MYLSGVMSDPSQPSEKMDTESDISSASKAPSNNGGAQVAATDASSATHQPQDINLNKLPQSLDKSTECHSM